MALREKMQFRSFDRYWKKQGRKDAFTWGHRYLRLHSELLEDSVYKEMYEYFRNTLIAYLKRDTKGKKLDDAKLGGLVDALADIFNQDGAEYVNRYKGFVELLYDHWKKDPNAVREIRI